MRPLEVLESFGREKTAFLERVIADSSILEEVSGLAEMKAGMPGSQLTEQC